MHLSLTAVLLIIAFGSSHVMLEVLTWSRGVTVDQVNVHIP